jgi:hypothetical protein
MMVLGAVLLSGCLVIETTHNADVSFQWSCEGRDCNSLGVVAVDVEIWDGRRLLTRVPADPPAVAATVHSLEPGTYTFTIIGMSPTGLVLYEATETFTARAGDNVYTVSLPYVGP